MTNSREARRKIRAGEHTRMKQPPDLQKAQDNMRPRVITLDGFLGTDTRNLIDILIEDDADVKRLNLDHRTIAARMSELRTAGMNGLGDFITVPPHFEVRVDVVRGRLPCPFGHKGLVRKTNITVRNLRLNREITYTELNIHMIGAHGFYEGRGATFRLDPAILAEILEVPPVTQSEP